MVSRTEISSVELSNLSKQFGSVVCLLVVNFIPDLPGAAIRSIRSNTNSPIVIGYTNPEDLRDLPADCEIFLYRLTSTEVFTRSEVSFTYQDFSTSDFFQLVKLKWVLFQNLISAGFEHVIYSDLDVVWETDLVSEMQEAHKIRTDVSIYVQSFTTEPGVPRLCMGFISFLCNNQVSNFLSAAHQVHTTHSQDGTHFGDDDAITLTYREWGYPSWVQELPQSSFPVGSMLNLYSGKTIFPGLSSPSAKLFHANYVIGLKNKVLLLYLFLGRYKSKELGINPNFFDFIELWLRRFKFLVKRWIR